MDRYRWIKFLSVVCILFAVLLAPAVCRGFEPFSDSLQELDLIHRKLNLVISLRSGSSAFQDQVSRLIEERRTAEKKLSQAVSECAEESFDSFQAMMIESKRSIDPDTLDSVLAKLHLVSFGKSGLSERFLQVKKLSDKYRNARSAETVLSHHVDHSRDQVIFDEAQPTQEGLTETASETYTIRLEDKFIIQVKKGIAVPESWKNHLLDSLRLLEDNFMPVREPIKVKVSCVKSSLAIAYNPAEDCIAIPGGSNIIDHGFKSLDRLDHELFHAFIGHQYPDLVSSAARENPEMDIIHEGTADFFASLKDNNRIFGDNYFNQPALLRNYETRMVYSLVTGAHAKGNTLTSYLIEKNLTLKDIADFFRQGTLSVGALVRREDHQNFGLANDSPKIEYSLEGLPPSKMKLYRLTKDTLLVFSFNQACHKRFGKIRFEFTDKNGSKISTFGFELISQDESRAVFNIQTQGVAASEKIVIRYHDSSSELIGFDVIYLRK